MVRMDRMPIGAEAGERIRGNLRFAFHDDQPDENCNNAMRTGFLFSERIESHDGVLWLSLGMVRVSQHICDFSGINMLGKEFHIVMDGGSVEDLRETVKRAVNAGIVAAVPLGPLSKELWDECASLKQVREKQDG